MFGRTLMLINPSARSNQASEAAAKAIPFIEAQLQAESTNRSVKIYRTLGQGDAKRFIEDNAIGYQSIIAIGGDGLIHEAINGLMTLPEEQRPQLGIIPCGNGDDFARSLGISRKPLESMNQLLVSSPMQIDIPRVNATYFNETLSFGLDAAIALQTMKLRKETKQTGTSLYLRCGIDQLKNHREIYQATIQLDHKQPCKTNLYMLAVQNGSFYGGGFKICPKANLCDGLLDICYAVPPLSFFQGVQLFLRAKSGKHITNKHIRLAQASKISIQFDRLIPAQTDGELLRDSKFEIEMNEKAISVLVPHID